MYPSQLRPRKCAPHAPIHGSRALKAWASGSGSALRGLPISLRFASRIRARCAAESLWVRS